MKKLQAKTKKNGIRAITVKDFIEKHYLPYAREIKSPGQMKKEQQHCNVWIIPVLGDKPMATLQDDPETETSAINTALELKKVMEIAEKSPRMIEYVFSTLRQVCRYGVKEGIISDEPDLDDIRKNLVVNNQRQRFLTQEEAGRLLSLLRQRDQTLADMAEFSLLTGCRRGELFGITWQDVSIDTSSVILRSTPGSKGRTLHLSKPAVDIIQRQPAGPPDKPVFSNKNGKAFHVLPYSWTLALKDSGLNEGVTNNRLKICWHSLRHTCASRMVSDGFDLQMVAKILGHQDLRMSQRYQHLLEQSTEE